MDFSADNFAHFVRLGQKINAIKELRGLLGVGLKEAKDMVEVLPPFRAEGVTFSAALDAVLTPPPHFAEYVVTLYNGQDYHVATFKGGYDNYQDAMDYGNDHVERSDVIVARVIAKTKRTLTTI